GDWVRAERSTGRTGRLLVPGLPRDDLVGGQLAVRNPGRCREDPLLEGRQRGQVELHVERSATAGEVLIELGEYAVAAPTIGHHTGTVGGRDPGHLAGVGGGP